MTRVRFRPSRFYGGAFLPSAALTACGGSVTTREATTDAAAEAEAQSAGAEDARVE
jgi:hypothetical protein